jgi:hypothetical protein
VNGAPFKVKEIIATGPLSHRATIGHDSSPTTVAFMVAQRRVVDRRSVLRLGAAGVSTLALARVLSACGGSSSSTSSMDGPISDSMSLVQRWVPDQLGPGTQRLPISLADNAGMLMKGPAELTGRVIDLDDNVIADNLVATRRSLGEGSTPFWVFETTIDEPDIYMLIIDGGPSDGASLQVRSTTELVVPRPGAQLPGFDTPTFDDHRGVEPMCSRLPEPCPFHDVTLNAALADGRRVVYIVGTPAHCRTGVCSPILEGLIPLGDEFTDTVFVHADVYADKAGTQVAPAVNDLSLTFEPVLFITDTTGTITHRFEGVWHPDEVRAALS